MDEYLADLELALHDPRLSGFDLYEAFHLLRPTPEGNVLRPVGNRLERIVRLARRLALA
jgi:hypothetical protein